MQKNSVLREGCCYRFIANLAPLLSYKRTLKLVSALSGDHSSPAHMGPSLPSLYSTSPFRGEVVDEIFTLSHSCFPANLYSFTSHARLRLHFTYMSSTKLHHLTTSSEFFRFYPPLSSKSTHPNDYSPLFFSWSPVWFPLSFL